MRHRPYDRDAAALLQGQSTVVVLQQDDRFPIQLPRDLQCLGGVDETGPLALRCSWVRVLKEAHLELCPQEPRDRRVDRLHVELSVLDKLRDGLEVATTESVITLSMAVPHI